MAEHQTTSGETKGNADERRDAMTRHNEKGLPRDRRGAVAVWVALMMVMLLGVVALTIDMGYLWVLRDRLQSTADAAALAGASQLPGEVDAKSTAVNYARKNLLPGAHGEVLCTAGSALAADCPDGLSDVVLGHWEGSPARTFTCHTADRNDPACPKPAAETTNAVKVTIRRAEANGNPVQLFFAAVLGIRTADVVAGAIAEWKGGSNNCFEDGILAGNTAYLGSDARLGDPYNSGQDYCVYGREGVCFDEGLQIFGQTTEVYQGSSVGSLYGGVGGYNGKGLNGCSTCIGGGTICMDEDAIYPQESIVTADLQPDLANNVEAIIAGLQSQSTSIQLPNGSIGSIPFPSQITAVEVLTNLQTVVREVEDFRSGNIFYMDAAVLPANLTPNTAYIFDGNLVIGEDAIVPNIIIAVRGSLWWDEGGTISNTQNCQAGRVAIGIVATNDIYIGSDLTAVGVDFIAGHDAIIDENLGYPQNNAIAVDVSIQAKNNVWIDEHPEILGCEDSISAFDTGKVIRLVN